jgi:hypothetical protein
MRKEVSGQLHDPAALPWGWAPPNIHLIGCLVGTTAGVNTLEKGIYALLRYCAALRGCSVPTFRDNLSVPSSRVKKFDP